MIEWEERLLELAIRELKQVEYCEMVPIGYYSSQEDGDELRLLLVKYEGENG